MPKYNVLATINQYFEVEAECADDAEIKVWQSFRKGQITIDESPIFMCEEEDLIEESEDA